jgi:hypothetical protein
MQIFTCIREVGDIGVIIPDLLKIVKAVNGDVGLALSR